MKAKLFFKNETHQSDIARASSKKIIGICLDMPFLFFPDFCLVMSTMMYHECHDFYSVMSTMKLLLLCGGMTAKHKSLYR